MAKHAPIIIEPDDAYLDSLEQEISAYVRHIHPVIKILHLSRAQNLISNMILSLASQIDRSATQPAPDDNLPI